MEEFAAVALLFLFTSWLPFALLLPLARRDRRLRIAWLPVIVGLLSSAYCAATFVAWPRASIRLDLLVVLAGVFAADTAAAILVVHALFRNRLDPAPSPRARRLARGAAFAAMAWLAVAAMGFAWSQFSAARSMAGYFHGQELLLAAKLRDRESAAIAYGPLFTADAALAPWIGVWDLASSTGRVTTLVVTADRRIWLRFDCTPGTCEAGPGMLQVHSPDRMSAQVPGLGGASGDSSSGGYRRESCRLLSRRRRESTAAGRSWRPPAFARSRQRPLRRQEISSRSAPSRRSSGCRITSR